MLATRRAIYPDVEVWLYFACVPSIPRI